MLVPMLELEVLSIFPELFEPYMSSSIMGRARRAGIFSFKAYNLRDWTHDAHKTVDDAPFGGGPGMLMKPEPFFEAVRDISASKNAASDEVAAPTADEAKRPHRPHIVMFSPAGVPFDQACASRLAKEERVLFLCGHYEGIDERVYSLSDEVISLGDYVLTGAELPAMVVMDAVIRLLPGALGDSESSVDESFSLSGLLEYAQYTRPRSYQGMDVPDILLSGNHQAIACWQRENALARTARLRPDLLDAADISQEEYDRARAYSEQVPPDLPPHLSSDLPLDASSARSSDHYSALASW